jgi:hypothetical protein
MKTKKIEFTGKFGIDGVYGGDTNPYWLVNEEVYEQIKGTFKYAQKEGNKYKIFLYDLVNYEDEGKKQTVSIRIVTKD